MDHNEWLFHVIGKAHRASDLTLEMLQNVSEAMQHINLSDEEYWPIEARVMLMSFLVENITRHSHAHGNLLEDGYIDETPYGSEIEQLKRLLETFDFYPKAYLDFLIEPEKHFISFYQDQKSIIANSFNWKEKDLEQRESLIRDFVDHHVGYISSILGLELPPLPFRVIPEDNGYARASFYRYKNDSGISYEMVVFPECINNDDCALVMETIAHEIFHYFTFVTSEYINSIPDELKEAARVGLARTNEWINYNFKPPRLESLYFNDPEEIGARSYGDYIGRLYDGAMMQHSTKIGRKHVSSRYTPELSSIMFEFAKKANRILAEARLLEAIKEIYGDDPDFNNQDHGLNIIHMGPTPPERL